MMRSIGSKRFERTEALRYNLPDADGKAGFHYNQKALSSENGNKARFARSEAGGLSMTAKLVNKASGFFVPPTNYEYDTNLRIDIEEGWRSSMLAILQPRQNYS
jgi:hypothetical protein